MVRLIYNKFWGILFSITLAISVNAQDVQLSLYSYPLNSNINSIEEAVQKNDFALVHLHNLLNLGLSDKPVWAKIILPNSESLNNKVIQVANPNLDEVTIYYRQNGVWITQTLKETDVVKNRPFPDQNLVFLLNDSIEEATIYFRITAGEQLLIPFEVADVAVIREKNANRDSIIYIYFGVMLVMFFYNFFIYLNTKDRNYLYYVLYILFVTLTQLTFHGFINKYLSPDFNYIKTHSVFLFGALSGIATLLFMQEFISTKKYLGRLNYIITFFVVIDIVAIILSAFDSYQLSYTFVNINAGLGSIIVLLIAIYVAIRGNRSAYFFLLSWTVFLSSVIIFVLKDYGAIEYNLLSKYALVYGSALEVTLLSIALADRINILKKDKLKAQSKALEIANENSRIIKEQNVLLEQKVIERTKSLTETNNNLSVALDTLKQAQSQLVEAEKMASLGQLTAGIAHEINNPINFVTSNVKPLHRDIAELYKLQEKTEEYIQNSGITLEPIIQYKSEIDYEYLKTELNYLLKGIHEGSVRTAEIVKGLRIFSRVDEIDIKHADINEGLESTIIIINNQLGNKIAVEKHYGDLPLVECYPGKLNQVFLNLISNGIYAVKEKFKDEVGGKIFIKTEVEDKNIKITIADNGTGMSESTKSKLFEPFFTTKPVGDGTGLGLSIVYNTIKKHNGSIDVNSELGFGTTFILTIPQQQPHG